MAHYRVRGGRRLWTLGRQRRETVRAGDSRREQFRRYLEKGGVLDALTKGTTGPETADVETLRLEVTELRQKYEALLEENKELKAKLAQFEPPKEEGQPE
ncbi:C-Myc-binding protein isoform X3 [Rhinoraja longicauda]